MGMAVSVNGRQTFPAPQERAENCGQPKRFLDSHEISSTRITPPVPPPFADYFAQ